MSIASEAQFDQARVAERMRDIREATRVVSEGFSREYMRECIDNHRFPQEAWEALGEYGLLGITIPEDLGGSGGGQVELVALMETLAEAGRFFQENAFMEELPAQKEALRGTFDPGYLNYTLGKLLI